MFFDIFKGNFGGRDMLNEICEPPVINRAFVIIFLGEAMLINLCVILFLFRESSFCAKVIL